ncbi:MAG: arginine--tRNA ligase [Lachnospiraceae bacterium]
MKKFIDLISEEVMAAFAAAGYDESKGKVTISNRPDLCEFQCNGAMALAKAYKCAPIAIANAVVEKLEGSRVFSEVSAVMPGFLNMKVDEAFLTEYIVGMSSAEKFGLEMPEKPLDVVIDFGGPNVAKPLHVGHLRSAIIGESIKRMMRYCGNTVIGDIHMGDWGLQMGLIISEVQERMPELPYFDMEYTGEYPAEAPFTISELEEIYPAASAKSKEDEAFKAKAMEATLLLQNGVRGYRAIWEQILAVSVADLKKNYGNLQVSFDEWKGESDAHPIIPSMIEKMQAGGFAYESEGALVVDVVKEEDTREMPPCMILKSDGAALYTTTDIATIMDRATNSSLTDIIYVVDKRQELHFEQVFRCARKTKMLQDETNLTFIGFGTMNGKDGKPFKTREGGVMRLEHLISEINEEMYQKIISGREVSEVEARETAKVVGLAALKYGDLSNQASKDYIFDMERFTSFEGDTGPYILYTIVRIKSILAKYIEQDGIVLDCKLALSQNESEKALKLELTKWSAMMEAACAEKAPHKVCAYIYDLANAFNKFYHETKIIAEEDEMKKAGWIALLEFTKQVLEAAISVLGFEAPEKM